MIFYPGGLGTMAESLQLKHLPQIRVGLALSDAGFYHRETMRLPEDLDQFFQLYQDKFETRQLFFEVQPEMPWLCRKEGFVYAVDEGNAWVRFGQAGEAEDPEKPFAEILEAMRGPANIFGVHQSIRNMDILSEDVHTMLETVESTQQGMILAQRISADYFVFHLAQSKDYWDWNRSEQIAIALKAFRELADFYKSSGFTFVPLLENLEFPKFPATAEEVVSLLRTCRDFFPNLKLCLDVPHLWHSRILLLENAGKFRNLIPDFSVLEAPFSDYLDYAMGHIFPDGGISPDDIFLYHMGGCWNHFTHEIPGLRPGESPFWHKLRLDEPEYSYDPRMEMNLPKVLNRILRFHLENRLDMLLVLEIYKKNYNEMLEAARIIHEDLLAKAVRIARNAHRYAYLWH